MFLNKFEQELKYMKEKLYLMLHKIEAAIYGSMTVLVSRNARLAQTIIDNDAEINALEREIEHDCLKLLLIDHPFAGDFREVSATLKVITDLERIGDQARDICRLTLKFGEEDYIKKLVHIPEMGRIVCNMVKESVHSYIAGDLEQAAALEHDDDKVDGLFEVLKAELVELIQKDPSSAEQAILFILIAKYLERIADHAVNIGEWTEYCVTGKHKGV